MSWSCDDCIWQDHDDEAGILYCTLDKNYSATKLPLADDDLPYPAWCALLSEWRDVKDEPLPEYGTWVVYYGNRPDDEGLDVQSRYSIQNAEDSVILCLMNAWVSHWLPLDDWPLPPAPKEADDAIS